MTQFCIPTSADGCDTSCSQDIGPQNDMSRAFGAPGAAVVSSESVTSMPLLGNQIAPAKRPVPKIVYNPKTKELNISALGYQLRCPNGLKITWLPEANGGTLSQVRSILGCLHVLIILLRNSGNTWNTLPPICARRAFKYSELLSEDWQPLIHHRNV